MGIFRGFRQLLEALAVLAASIVELAKCQRDAGPPLERLDALELSRHQFEAQVEGVLLKAEGKLKAAANAEARERQLKKSYERDVDPLDPDSEKGPPPAAIHDDDVEAGKEERVRALRLDVAPLNSKTAAVRAKWG